MLRVVGNDLQNQRVLSDGFRVGGTGSFAMRKFVSFRPTEDVYCFDQPKFVFHSDLKSSLVGFYCTGVPVIEFTLTSVFLLKRLIKHGALF